ncbi:MAG: hypothetical protein IKW54_01085 [Bacteroidales bacterium]|nr:hypothetical protein [Bacteroidales bacterium]
MAIYNNTRNRLMDIQKGKKESDLFPVLKELFRNKQYNNVEITHGIDEYGKDLVFSDYDSKLGENEWYAVVVKNKNAEMKDFESQGEITRQIQLSFEYPHKRSNGEDIYINKVIVIVNGTISTQAKNVIQKVLPVHQRNNVYLWNYQKLEEEINNHIKDLFLSGEMISQEDFIVSTYKKNLTEKLLKLDNAQELFSGLSITQINDIFVNVRTANQRYENEKKKYQNNIGSTFREEIDDSISIINSNKNTIIRGIPTSGKTLLLKRIGINSLSNYKDIGVFWFRFRDIQIDNFDLNKEIDKQFYELSGNNHFNQDFFRKYLFLFDALDEITDNEKRITIINKLQKQVSGLNNGFLIISGRNIELFKDISLFTPSNYEIVDLLPFDIGQALKLVKKIIPDNKEKNNHFITAIKKQQLSNNLTRTPMALTLMAIMYKDDAIDLKELPANITELYNKFSDYYLDKWDASKGITSQYKYEEYKHIIGFIAHHLHSNHIYEVSSQNLKDFLETIKTSHSTFEELKDTDNYISILKSRNTLLHYDADRDVFYFNSSAFQEYFTSIYFDDSNENILIENIYQEWWQNVIIFYNGKNPKRSVFIEKILNCIPGDSASMFYHLQIMSKSLQAAHLISNKIADKAISNMIGTFDKFYKSLVSSTDGSIAYQWTTLDMILQCRNLFDDLFNSKHINTDIVSNRAHDILTTNNNQFSDVTLYSLAYYLAHKNRDAKYFNMFLSTQELNTRWDRIIFRDIEYMKIRNSLPEKTYQRIKRKQEYNKIYIDQQFKEPAILHLTDGTKIKK